MTRQMYKQFLNQQIKTRKKMEELKEYLQKEFDRTVLRKYRHLFEQWFSKLTDNQIMYYTAYMQGKKSPFV